MENQRIVLASRAAVCLSEKAAAGVQALSSAAAGLGVFGLMAVGFAEAESSVVSRLGCGVGASSTRVVGRPLSSLPLGTDVARNTGRRSADHPVGVADAVVAERGATGTLGSVVWGARAEVRTCGTPMTTARNVGTNVARAIHMPCEGK